MECSYFQCLKRSAQVQYNYTVSQKNDTDVTHSRFNPHQPILVIFGRDVAERVCYWMLIFWFIYVDFFIPPLLTNVSALPRETRTRRLCLFSTPSRMHAATQILQEKTHACGVLKRHNFRVHVSLGSAETLVRTGGIINHHSIAYSLSNISAKNYRNRLMWVESIVCNISVVFLGHSVQYNCNTRIFSCTALYCTCADPCNTTLQYNFLQLAENLQATCSSCKKTCIALVLRLCGLLKCNKMFVLSCYCSLHLCGPLKRTNNKFPEPRIPIQSLQNRTDSLLSLPEISRKFTHSLSV